MAIFTALAVISALAGGALRIGGRIANHRRLERAIEEATEKGFENLLEGQAMSISNAQSLTQDMTASLGYSGVSAQEGTAAELLKQTEIQKNVTVNKMSQDYESWVKDMEEQRKASKANVIFGAAGDALSTMGNLLYDYNRIQAENVEPLSSQNYPENAGGKNIDLGLADYSNGLSFGEKYGPASSGSISGRIDSDINSGFHWGN